MYCPRQQKLFSFPASPAAHGGTLGIGKRKEKRLLCVKRSLHVVLRSEKAKGRRSLLYPSNARRTFFILKKYAKRFDVRIYGFVNVGNHLHLSVKAKTKEGFRNFLRVSAGQIAQAITGARPGKRAKFWDRLAYSRIIEWGKGFKIVQLYLKKNLIQAAPSGSFSLLSTLKR